MPDNKCCGTCENRRRDVFTDKPYCKFDEADFYQGKKTNEVKRYWHPACEKYLPKEEQHA